MLVLDHEKLEVYQVTRQLSAEINRVRRKIKPGRPDLVDQALRSTASITLNIAESSGEKLPRRRCYFFRIARSSATELAAALDHLVDMELLKANDIVEAKHLVVRIVSMLVKLTDKVDSPDSYPPLPKRRQPRTR
jgi:four helix bundle protein